MRMIDEDEVGLKEKPENTLHKQDYIVINPKHRECGITTLPLLGLRIRTVHVRHA